MHHCLAFILNNPQENYPFTNLSIHNSSKHWLHPHSARVWYIFQNFFANITPNDSNDEFNHQSPNTVLLMQISHFPPRFDVPYYMYTRRNSSFPKPFLPGFHITLSYMHVPRKFSEHTDTNGAGVAVWILMK